LKCVANTKGAFMRTKISMVSAFALSLCAIAPASLVWAQSVNVETRSAAESQNNVRIQGGGQGVEVETNSSAQSGSRTRVRDEGGAVRVDTQSGAASQSNVRVQGGAPGQSIEVNSGAAAASQNRVRMDNGGAGTVIDSRSGAASQSNVRVYAPPQAAPLMGVPQNETSIPMVQPPPVAAVPVSPPPAGVDTPPPVAGSNPAGSMPVKPVNCEKIEEVSIDDMTIKIINKSCRGKIMSLQAWRENGKTKVQFIFDNKGFSNTTIKMSEIWYDRRGRAIDEKIDEQKFAIEANHNNAVIITGPVPQAMTAVINFYR
jgi:uncharacterized protein YcfL